jgi:hypothetical protein
MSAGAITMSESKKEMSGRQPYGATVDFQAYGDDVQTNQLPSHISDDDEQNIHKLDCGEQGVCLH